MNNPLIPDWSTYLTRAEAHLKQAEDAALLHDWDRMINALGDVQQQINGVVGWCLKREIVAAK